MMNDRESNQSFSNAAWAKWAERRLQQQRNNKSQASPNGVSAGEPIPPDALNDWLIEDLELNAMLDHLSSVDHGAGVFVEDVLSKIESQQIRAAKQNRWKTKREDVKTFAVLEFDVVPSDTFSQTTPDDIDCDESSKNIFGRKSLIDLAVIPPAKTRLRSGKKTASECVDQDGPTVSKSNKKSRFSRGARLGVAVAVVLLVGTTLGVAYFVAADNDQPTITKKDTNPGNENEPDDRLHPSAINAVDEKNNIVSHDNSLSDDPDHENPPNVNREHEQPQDQIVEINPRHEYLNDKNIDNDIPKTIENDNSERRPTQWLASIRSESNAIWAKRPDDDFTNEPLELQQGTVELMTHDGAQLTIRAPAEFNFVSRKEIQIKRGKLSAFVPSTARGFSVLTPSVTVIDHGREFYVGVDKNKTSRVYTKSGKVEVHTRPKDQLAGKSWKLSTGQSSVVTGSGAHVQWLLSLQFDNHGFGHIEFNGTVMENPVFTENADFVLRNIFKSVTPKILAAEKHSKQPLLGAIVVNSDVFLIHRAREMTPARLSAVKAIENLEIQMPEKIDSRNNREFRSAYQKFAIKHKMFVRRVENDAANLPPADSLTPNIRLPDNPAAIKFATPDQNDLVKSIINQTVLLLESRAEKMPNKQPSKTAIAKKQRGLNAPKDPQNMFARLINVDGFGDFTIDGLLSGEQSKPLPSEKPLLQMMDETTLQKQLWNEVAEVDLFSDDKVAKQAIQYATRLNRHAIRLRQQNLPPPETMDEPLKKLLPQRPDLNGLPLAMGDDCILDADDATALASVSNDLGTTISQFNAFGSLPGEGAFSLRDAMVSRAISHSIAKNKGDKSVPGLVQMLQADHPRVRYQLIKKLQTIGTDLAIETIAKRAIFDLNPEIRLAATESLKEFPPEKYRPVLLQGMRYPLAAVAQHSAEALVRLNDVNATNELVELIDLPSPNRAFKNKNGQLEMREVIGINHMRNCMLCHPPSNSMSDPVRGSVPTPGERLPQKYYQHSTGAFVRADVTYLRQDFSVVQPVPNPGPWPKMQRFDYVVRTRGLTPQEQKLHADTPEPKTYPQREALLFAMRKLTGQKVETDNAENWRNVLAQQNREKPETGN